MSSGGDAEGSSSRDGLLRSGAVPARRALGGPIASRAPEDALYRRRLVRVYAVLLVYGAIALFIDGAVGEYRAWVDRVHWPRILALAVLSPLTLAAAKGWISDRTLRLTEPLVFVGIVAEIATETILSRAPTFNLDQPAVVMLFLRACFIPSSIRAQAAIGGLVTVATAIAAKLYIQATGLPLSPFLAGTPGAFQVVNVLVGGTVFVGITSYVTHTIGKLRVEAHDARRMGQYVLEEKIGEGGMGEVWRARHALLQRPTAVKVIRGDVSDELVARFEREVRAAAQLTHASSIAVYDFGVAENGRLFYAMELLRGLTLDEVVERTGPLPAARVAHLLDGILGALDEAHALGLVHRDVKPANVMVIRNGTEHDFPKLLDYGLVHLQRRRDQSAALTQRGTLAGTPLYMAPEQISDASSPDGRTDLYALGAVGYFLLTGEPPFTGRTAATVMSDHLTRAPTPPSERSELDVPGDLEAVVMRALAKDPADRFATAAAMRAALRACGCHGAWSEAEAAAWWSLHAPQIDAIDRDAA